MADASKKLELGAFSNELRMARLEYDFSKDGGATGDLELAIARGNIIVHDAWVHVPTACTSGGSATVAIGIDGGDEDAFLDITSGAVAALTENAVLSETTARGLFVADGSEIQLTIATAALTAGKINVHVAYSAAE